jgi:hypothetical protein
MTPNHILSEIALRLHEASPGQIKKVANAVGIDLSAASEPFPSIGDAAPALRRLMPSDGDVVHGAVPFEMKLTVLGQELTQTCRAVFSAFLVDDVDRRTNEPIRILGPTEINWQILDWRDLGRLDEETGEPQRATAPVWTDDFDALLPTAVPGLLMDQIEEQARALEQSLRKSDA